MTFQLVFGFPNKEPPLLDLSSAIDYTIIDFGNTSVVEEIFQWNIQNISLKKSGNT